MLKNYFHEKIALYLSCIILCNYLFLILNFPQIIKKLNFIVFFVFLSIFYFRKFSENVYLKIFFLLIIFISLGTPTFEWDPRSIWLFHAKRIYYDNSIFSVADNYASFSHNDYPSLIPAFSSSLASLLGYWNEIIPKLSFTLMYFPPLILAYVFLKETKYVVFLSIVLFIIGKHLFNGWADGLVAVYFCLSSLLMYTLIIDKSKFEKNLLYYLIAFCFFITLSLTKNEGFALLILLFFITFSIKLYKGTLIKDIHKLILLSFSFIPVILWKLFCYSNGIENDYINSSFLLNLSSRLTELDNIKLMGYFLLLNEKFLICLIFFIITFWLRKNNLLFCYITIITIAYIFIIFLVFLSTPVDFHFQLNSAATRIVKTLSFLLSFFALYNLKDYKKNIEDL